MSKKNRFKDEEDFNEIMSSNNISEIAKIKEDLNSILRNDIKIIAKNESQKKLINSIKNNEITICAGHAGCGKAQPLDSLILSENGFKLMKDVKINDKIYSQSGNLTNVIGIYPQGIKDIYGITFNDDSYTECCNEHLWLVKSILDRNAKRNFKIKQLKDIKNDIFIGNKKNYSIPIANPIKFNKKNIEIHPYILGILLGDGCFTAGNIRLTNFDSEIIDYINQYLPDNYILNKLSPIEYSIVMKNKLRYEGFNYLISTYNLLNVKSENKFIPNDYLINNIENRINLLQGLMDSDGTIDKLGKTFSFSTSSKKLINDFRFLIESLGGTVNKLRIKKGKYKKNDSYIECKESYTYSFRLPDNIIPFKLKRKINLIKKKMKYFPIRYIKDIKYVGKKEAQCIMVDDESHTYLTNNLIVTHNTYISVAYALSLLRKTSNKFKKIYLVKSVTPLKGEEIGFIKGPQPLYEKILTPDGWSEMKDIKIGDYVINNNGEKVKVNNIKEYDYEDIYRITLKDNRYVDCSLHHLWNIKTKNLDFFTVNTDFLLKHYKKVEFYLPHIKPVKYKEQNIDKLNPYMLGVFIGDGCLTSSHVRFCNNDDEIINKMKTISESYNLKLTKNNITYNLVPEVLEHQIGAKEIKITNILNNEEYYGSLGQIKKYLNIVNTSDVTVIGRCNRKSIVDNYQYEYTGKVLGSFNKVKNYLIEYDLFGKCSYDKFIPNVYKTASIEDRFELVRGLLDTDGTIKKNGEITFTTTSIRLANDLKEIILSLGGSARVYTRNILNKPQNFRNQKIIQRRPIHTVYIKFLNNENNPFYLSRKANRFKSLDDFCLKIVNIEKIGNEKTKCLNLEGDNPLYISKDFIVTHNSIEDKVEPFMWSFYINIEKLILEPTLKVLLEKEYIKPFPLAYMRGASLDDCIIITDEAQNVTMSNARTLMTRIGSNCKLIILGDFNQIDIKESELSSLQTLIDMFKETDNIGVIEMSKSDTNIRNPLIDVIESKFNELDEKNKNKKFRKIPSIPKEEIKHDVVI